MGYHFLCYITALFIIRVHSITLRWKITQKTSHVPHAHRNSFFFLYLIHFFIFLFIFNGGEGILSRKKYPFLVVLMTESNTYRCPDFHFYIMSSVRSIHFIVRKDVTGSDIKKINKVQKHCNDSCFMSGPWIYFLLSLPCYPQLVSFCSSSVSCMIFCHDQHGEPKHKQTRGTRRQIKNIYFQQNSKQKVKGL